MAKALERQSVQGGRLGTHLVAIGAISQAVLENFLRRTPAEPKELHDTGIDETDLMSLLLKLIYVNRLKSVSQFVQGIKLPYTLVHDLVQMANDRTLLRTLSSRESGHVVDPEYTLTEDGRRWTIDALQRVRYVGPAPVPLADFIDQVNLQKPTNELVTMERLRKAIQAFTFDDAMLEQCGPALNSGRAMLLYGPPGNGKSSIANCMASVFSDIIYVPYAISVEGQIISFHDSRIHVPLTAAEVKENEAISLTRSENFDTRWVPCKRPFVITGGELTLDMLDLRYDENAHFYEAPLHMKALGGCFIIDDFGRQLVSPTHLLNRWIVPLENRVDYMKLNTGKTFSIPFEALIIFSTNLEPEDLMDPAFLRRLPYKIEVGSPSVDNYRRIFEKECARNGLTLPDGAFDAIVTKLKKDKGLDLAAYQPRFIVDQVVATCKFLNQPPHFEPRYIEYALSNLRVNRTAPPAPAPSSRA